MSELSAKAHLRVFSLTGGLVHRSIAISDVEVIPLPEKGVYIVTDGSATTVVIN